MKIALSGTQENARYKNISCILGLDEVPEVPVYLGWLFVINSWSKAIQFKC